MLFALRLSAAVRSISTSAARPAAMAKSFYAVATGRQRGLFRSWEECQAQVKGYPRAVFKGFKTEEEAQQFLQHHGVEVAGAAAQGEAPAAAAAAAGQAAGAAPRRKRPAADAGGGSGSNAKRRAAAAPAPVAAAAATAATNRVLRLEFDGACKQNPGPAGFGAVLYDDTTGVEVERLCQYIGDHRTNNQAEYAGLIAGLAAALRLGCTRLKVQGDSNLVIQQLMGNWQVKNEGLRPYHRLAQQLARRFDRFEAQQVLREFNKVADALSNQAIDEYRSGANRQLWTLEAAAAAAEARGGGAAGLAAELYAADAWDGEVEGDQAPNAAAAAAGTAAAEAAAAAAAAAGEGEGEAAAAAAAAAQGGSGGEPGAS